MLASCGNGARDPEAVATEEVETGIPHDPAGEPTTPTEKPGTGEDLARLIRQLDSGVDRLRQQSGYSAEVTLLERVDGELADPHVVNLICRHDPFSTYLKWTQGPVGRELLYVAGRNKDKVVVHPEGFRGRFVSRISLDQDSPLIMSERRYPISEFGLLKLNERLLGILQKYVAAGIDVDCSQRSPDEATRPGSEFTIELSRRVEDDIYRRVIVVVDEEFSIAVALTGYTWPARPAESEADTLIESYAYRSIDFGCPVTDATFDVSNPEYHFSR